MQTSKFTVNVSLHTTVRQIISSRAFVDSYVFVTMKSFTKLTLRRRWVWSIDECVWLRPVHRSSNTPTTSTTPPSRRHQGATLSPGAREWRSSCRRPFFDRPSTSKYDQTPSKSTLFPHGPVSVAIRRKRITRAVELEKMAISAAFSCYHGTHNQTSALHTFVLDFPYVDPFWN